MYTQTVTITSNEEFNTTIEFNLVGGAMLAADDRFDDSFYHHYLINNQLIGDKTLVDSTTMTIVRENLTEEQKDTLEQMYQAAKAVYNDNGWDATWTFK